MRSNVCKIEKGKKDLQAILTESERVASYNGLSEKQALQLRLLCEEVDGMLPNIVDNFDGDFWIDYDNGVCKVNVSIVFAEFTVEKKKELIDIAKNKKNAAATGIVGKIRSVIEDIFLNNEVSHTYALGLSSEYYDLSADYGICLDSSYVWSLGKYKNTIEKETQTEAWDELEKSIIASLADDVIVGVKGTKANIVIIKKFA